MAYHEALYLAVFLPIVMLLFQIIPQKLRPYLLLCASYVFFWSFSKYLIVYIIATSLVIYGVGLWIDKLQKKCKTACTDLSREEKKAVKSQYLKKEKAVLIGTIILIIGVLVFLKYSNFIMINLSSMIKAIKYQPVKLLIPIGISFYSLQAISYVTDVYWEKIKAERNFGKVALFLSFFPHVLEGPICMYDEHMEALWKCDRITYDNFKHGFMRIGWGLMKKMVVADRLYKLVSTVYSGYESYNGIVIIVTAICYTTQLYMEFSGCMDIVIGTAKIFGVTLQENFRQPFVSKNAGEFWRRWHISLGLWFKTYIFYPVSSSKLVKKWNKFASKKMGKYVAKIGTSAFTLLPVWFCNGIWHGAEWGYLFYGLYYFVILLLEVILEPVKEKLLSILKIDASNKIWSAIMIFKTWIIIFTGELFFRAEKLDVGVHMFKSIFKDFSLKALWDGTILHIGLSSADFACVILFTIMVGIVGHFKEKQVDIYSKIDSWKTPARWALYYAVIFAVIIFGAYGTGYQKVDLIYAGF